MSGHGVATTITASPRTGSPLAAHARPATASVNGRKTAAYRSASRVNGARSLSAVRTSSTTAAYALSDAGRVTRASKGFPAFDVPDRTSPPAGIVTGRGSPVSADWSTTATEPSTVASAGTISPARTTTRSPGTSCSTDTSSTPSAPWRCAIRGARSTRRRSSRRARPAAHASSAAPPDIINATIAPASCSPRMSAPAIATSAIASTPTSPCKRLRTVSTVSGISTTAAPTPHAASAQPGSPTSHRTPPVRMAVSATIANSRSFMPPSCPQLRAQSGGYTQRYTH